MKREMKTRRGENTENGNERRKWRKGRKRFPHDACLPDFPFPFLSFVFPLPPSFLPLRFSLHIVPFPSPSPFSPVTLPPSFFILTPFLLLPLPSSPLPLALPSYRSLSLPFPPHIVPFPFPSPSLRPSPLPLPPSSTHLLLRPPAASAA